MLNFICVKLFLLIVAPSWATQLLRTNEGHDASPDEFPYVVSLELHLYNKTDQDDVAEKIHMCAASVLTSKWTITACHCVPGSHISGIFKYLKIIKNVKRGFDPSKFTSKTVISYGNENGQADVIEKFSEVLGVAEFPSKRTLPVMVEDIILLRTQPIMMKQYAKLSALDYTTLIGHEVTLGGYITSAANGTNKDTLRSKSLQVASGMIERCEKTKQMIDGFPSLCVVPLCGKSGITGGDSGGPVIHPSGIVALKSRDLMPQDFDDAAGGSVGQAGVVTPLSLYINWITRTAVD